MLEASWTPTGYREFCSDEGGTIEVHWRARQRVEVIHRDTAGAIWSRRSS